MKNLIVKRAIWASAIVYLMGIIAFLGSYYLPVWPDPDVQANWVLALAIIPAVIFGAHFYYYQGSQTNGWLLGLFMFAGAIVLDALITVPLFIIPNGGNHATFFMDPGFWLIGLEYVLVVAIYSLVRARPGNQPA